MPRTLTPCPMPQLFRQARDGDYQPDQEATSYLSRSALNKYVACRPCSALPRRSPVAVARLTSANKPSLTSNGVPYSEARGRYGMPFGHWLLGIAIFPLVPVSPPSQEWLTTCLAYLQHDCRALVRQEAKRRHDLFKYRLEMDRKHGSSTQGFAAMRPDQHPPITCVQAPIACKAVFHRQIGPQTYRYKLDAGVHLEPWQDFLVYNQRCAGRAQQDGFVDFECEHKPPCEVQVQQEKFATAPHEQLRPSLPSGGPSGSGIALTKLHLCTSGPRSPG